MQMTTGIAAIAKALLAAQKAMGDAKKDSRNPFFKSSYADLNTIREVCTPVLNEHGVTLLQPTFSKDGKNYVETVLLHESGELLLSETEIVCSKPNDPQAHGSGISYARRYALQSFLNIGAVDDDGESNYERPAAKAARAAPSETVAPSRDVTGYVPKKPEPKQDRATVNAQITANSKVVIAKKLKTLEELKADIKTKYGVDSAQLTDDQASELLATLKGLANGQ